MADIEDEASNVLPLFAITEGDEGEEDHGALVCQLREEIAELNDRLSRVQIQNKRLNRRLSSAREATSSARLATLYELAESFKDADAAAARVVRDYILGSQEYPKRFLEALQTLATTTSRKDEQEQ